MFLLLDSTSKKFITTAIKQSDSDEKYCTDTMDGDDSLEVSCSVIQ